MTRTGKRVLKFAIGLLLATFFLGASILLSVYASSLSSYFGLILVGFGIASLGLCADALGFRIRAIPLIPLNNQQAQPAPENEDPQIKTEHRRVFYKVTHITETTNERGEPIKQIKTVVDVQIPSEDNEIVAHTQRRHSAPF